MAASIFPLRSLVLLAPVLVLLNGCVVAPAPRPVYSPQPAVVYPQPVPGPIVYQAPPPPPAEVYGVAPAPGYFWIGGIWLWEGNRHVWHPGHWEAPRHGQVYVPHAWVPTGRGWQLQGGHWRR